MQSRTFFLYLRFTCMRGTDVMVRASHALMPHTQPCFVAAAAVLTSMLIANGVTNIIQWIKIRNSFVSWEFQSKLHKTIYSWLFYERTGLRPLPLYLRHYRNVWSYSSQKMQIVQCDWFLSLLKLCAFFPQSANNSYFIDPKKKTIPPEWPDNLYIYNSTFINYVARIFFCFFYYYSLRISLCVICVNILYKTMELQSHT